MSDPSQVEPKDDELSSTAPSVDADAANQGDANEQANEVAEPQSTEDVEASGPAIPTDELDEDPADPLTLAEAEVGQLKDALLRLRAEMDNRDKRAEREMVKARKFALERLMRDFIQVLDTFDQAIEQSEAGGSEGLALTQKLAVKVLSEHGLDVLEPTGEAFDPNWHEAIVAQPSDQQAPDTVLEVLQKGYRLNDRLIRPARVVVAKPLD
ncbi:MAG: nucleotide exchange factor GrpE [Pseudomonadota bacterium]